MIKKFFNVFRTNKSKLTMEELEICLKIANISVGIFCISTILVIISMMLVTVGGIKLGCVGVLICITWIISFIIASFGSNTYGYIQKLEDIKNNDLKAKKIVSLIREGKFNEIYCKDKDINKMLLDISLEKRNVEINIKEDNIVVTADGMEIPLAVDNVNDYFGMY